MICKKCGKDNDNLVKFCSGCGDKFEMELKENKKKQIIKSKKDQEILRKKIKLIAIIIFLVVIVILVWVILGMANKKSPDSSKNLFKYLIFHQREWECLDSSGKSYSSERIGNNVWKNSYANEIRNYYFDIPILKRSCEDGLISGYEIIF
ncbi:MAG: hypothetical protein Q8P20_06745 [bacterium]|nr:hypothetical protein [bacterium]